MMDRESGQDAIETFNFPCHTISSLARAGNCAPGLSDRTPHARHHCYLFALDFCRGQTILDVACGDGYGSHLLGQSSSRVVGIDGDAQTMSAARLKYGASNLDFAAAKGTAIPFPNASFDRVVSFETVEHPADWREFLSECARVLKPDGILLISFPNHDLPDAKSDHADSFHFNECDREQLREAVSAHFDNIVLLEQRDIVGSMLVPWEQTAKESGKFLENQDGNYYQMSRNQPSARHLIAIASNQPVKEVGESLLIDSSRAAGDVPQAGTVGSSVAAAHHSPAQFARHIQRLEARAARAERRADTLRRSILDWSARRTAVKEILDMPGAGSGRRCEPAAAKARRRDPRWRFFGSIMRALQRRRLLRHFDAAYYLRQNPDVAEAGVDPLVHYLETGWKEGRNPSARFSTNGYLAGNADVRALGINPLLHFVEEGHREGRSSTPSEQDRYPIAIEFAGPVPLLDAPPPAHRRAELIAFYLPQFHPIAENDAWWGEGFTEWTNVRAARPQFEGHDQPRRPGELGYYDLLDKNVQRRQIELAKLYGIGGFCFYFYWFNGKRLLEKPVEAWLDDPSLDFPFCLCWANENWTRRWDGDDAHVLIAQNYAPEDDIAFIKDVAPYLRDPRYIRVDGKPILIVYRPNHMPRPRETADCWRTWCRQNGIGEIHIAYTHSFENLDPATFGFDAAIEFPPNNFNPLDITHAVKPAPGMDNLKVLDWGSLLEKSESYNTPPYRIYRSVCPGWDNAARRRDGGVVFIGNTPELYKLWLSNAIADTERRFTDPGNRLIFINAWNEWGEGAYLEPDQRYGYAWLQATRDAVEARPGALAVRPSVVLVSHDAHPHGAQYLALHLGRAFVGLGYDLHIIMLGDGPLTDAFATIGTLERIDLTNPSQTLARLRHLRTSGSRLAIVNTTVSGSLLPLLKRASFRTVSLVHEMPSVLSDLRLDAHAKAIADDADVIVFPADLVRQGFETFCGRALDRALILPQGVIRPNPYRDHREEAHRQVCNRLNLPADTKIVLAVAFVEHRKGPDLFLDAAGKLLARRQDVVFLWIGHFDPSFEHRMAGEIQRRGLTGKVHFLGFVAEPLDYYAAASVYALTSREDPFPNVVLESAAVGVPVVAFAGTTGAADFIREHGGRLVTAFDCDAFARQMDELISHPPPSAGKPLPSIRQYALDLMKLANGQLRVSVVLPNFNYARYLRERLRGLTGQTCPVYEIIVLDDASTDDSLEVARSFAGEHAGFDIRIVSNAQNSGSVFRQWQKCLQSCTGDLVWIAEADDIAEPDFVERLSGLFADRNMVMAYSQSRQIDVGGAVLAPDYLDYTSDISDAWRTDHVHDGEDEIATAMAVKNTIPNVSAVLFRRSALEAAFAALGDRVFDLRVAGDWLLYMHVLRQGKIGFVAAPLNNHRRHATSVTAGSDGRRHYEEVALMQDEAAALVPVSADTRIKARRWLAHVKDYLGVTGSEAAS